MLTLLVGLFTGSIVGAATARWNVTATVASDIKVSLDDVKLALKDGTGAAVYPIVYNGSTYLPVRAVADNLGLSVQWDSASATVKLYTATNNTDPVKDFTAPTEPTQPTQPTGTRDPLYYEMGTNLGSAKFKLTINSIKPLTSSEISKLGFKVDTDDRIEYVLANMTIAASDIKRGSASKYDPAISALALPLFDKVVSDSSSLYVIGAATTYGFTNSIESQLQLASEKSYGSKYATAVTGKTYTITATGDAIIGIIKGQTSTLQIRTSDFLDSGAGSTKFVNLLIK